MKRCSYCGTEYPDDVQECPVDHEPTAVPSIPMPLSRGPIQNKYEIPPLDPTGKTEWVMILSPQDKFKGDIVLGRLRVAGIRARFDDAVTGGAIYTTKMRVIQVRVEDYD